ncbi:unnamed protein product [Coffea canephora]|uniref:NADP-dependent oxidoreductase domain-containing protein n=1 Tax=Coffea canephora TaxID=49390 RepID=A0A068UPD9_COFCA|nr:unnamed protein product [Coffea canephora]
MSFGYGPPKPEADRIKLIHYAINCGITHLDTSSSSFYASHRVTPNYPESRREISRITPQRIDLVISFAIFKLFLFSLLFILLTIFRILNTLKFASHRDRDRYAETDGCTTSQLALAWVHHQGATPRLRTWRATSRPYQ